MKETDTAIEKLRKELDLIDDSIADLLSERVSVASKIIEIKKNNNISLEDSGREERILARISKTHPSIAPLLKSVFGRIFDWVKSR